MHYEFTRKGRLPACALSEALLDSLRDRLLAGGDFVWNAVISGEGDLLGKDKERPQEVVHDWQQLKYKLASLPRISELRIIAEYQDGAGVISVAFQNFHPAGGILAVCGNKEWVDEQFCAIANLFTAAADAAASRLYSRVGKIVLQSVAPLTLACVIVLVAAALVIPGTIRRSEYIWWISAGTVVATLKLGEYLSDFMIKKALTKYPYIHWRA
ncbi:MAG: hypothetical protein N2491_04130 [Negativicutes bacterium]|nr:hypothetical protein [Negativicutes bacterium]